MNYLFIDCSYYCFYRYYAIKSWYNRINKEKNENFNNDMFSNEVFKNKYDKLFINKIDELINKLGISNFKLFLAQDCRRCDIWRNEFHDNYKGNRVQNDNNIGKFIKHSYNELFPINSGVQVKKNKLWKF